MHEVSQTVTIYTLADPTTGEIRYVGKAIDLAARFHGHFYENHQTSKSHKANWIKSLKDRGLKPVMEVLEQTTDDDWQESERFWIESLRQLGFKLTNLTVGGDGITRMLPEVREKIRQKKLGTKASPETLEKRRLSMLKHLPKMRLLKLGTHHSESTRKKIGDSNRGGKRTAETRAKMSAWQIGRKMSPEAIEKSRQANLGKKLSPESIAKRQATARAKWEHQGFRFSQETRKKMSVSSLGKKWPEESLSDETWMKRHGKQVMFA